MKRIGVVGCGLMGAGIAEVCARAGLDVVVAESSETAAGVGQTRLEKSLLRAEERGKLGRSERRVGVAGFGIHPRTCPCPWTTHL